MKWPMVMDVKGGRASDKDSSVFLSHKSLAVQHLTIVAVKVVRCFSMLRSEPKSGAATVESPVSNICRALTFSNLDGRMFKTNDGMLVVRLNQSSWERSKPVDGPSNRTKLQRSG